MKSLWLLLWRNSLGNKTLQINAASEENVCVAFKCHKMKQVSPYIMVDLCPRSENSPEEKASDFRMPGC